MERISHAGGAESEALPAQRWGIQGPDDRPGKIIFPDTDQSTDFDFTFSNSLPDIRYGAEAGLEIGYIVDPRNKFLFGTSAWQSGSTSSIRTEIPFQGNLTPVGYERSARLSYFQYYMGWQRTLVAESKRYRIHTRLSMHEVFDIDYKEDLVFGFQPPGTDTFKRIVVMEAHATGLLMFQLGLGGEYFIRDWVSLGGDVGYTVGLQKFRLSNAKLSSDIQPDDNLNFRTPLQIGADGKMNYLAEVNSYDDVTYRKLELEFDGWRALLNANLYF